MFVHILYITFFLSVFEEDIKILKDENPRPGVTKESLSKLKTVFKEGMYFISTMNKYSL